MEDIVEIAEVDVWATAVKSSSVELDGDAMAIKQADHISDLLRSVPGIDVGGAHSLNQRITIRSMDDKDLRITIDGAEQNNYMYHHMGNLQIHADILEAVDIEVGKNSVINGSLGGAVHFKTKSAKKLLQGDDQFGGRIQLGYGDNFGTSAALTLFGQLSEQVDVLGYYNQVKREDFRVGGDKIKDANGDEIEGTNGKVQGFEGDLSDTLVKVGWDVSESERFTLGYEYYVDKGDYTYRPDMGLGTDLPITNSLGAPLLWPTQYTRDTITLNYENGWADHSLLTATAFYNNSELQRDEHGWAEAGWGDYAGIVTGNAINTGLKTLGESELGAHLLKYGAEFVQYRTQYQGDYPTPESASEVAKSYAIFIEDKISLGSGFAIKPGVRYDVYDIDSTVVDDSFDAPTFGLEAEFVPVDSLVFTLGTTQLFKGPEIGEIFVGGGLYDTANPDIDAETGWNTQFSMAYSDDVLGADKFSTGFTLFNTQINDYIYDYATPPEGVEARSWKDNIGDLEIQGLEAYLGYELGGFSALISYSIADSELDADAQYQQYDGARLDRTQGDTFALDLGYMIAPVDLTLSWSTQVIGSLDAEADLDELDNPKDGFTVHNIAAQWQPRQVQGLSLTVGVDNLFDEYYASQSSRTGTSFHPRFGELYLQDFEPGRNIKLTAAYNF
ncbi:MAG: TonB-dependent receptor [Pseudomonadota bacterium]|nr:TonB-dependent receptor [Pseudomonadota bacterium]